MKNLFVETMSLLSQYGKTAEDVAWVGCLAKKISWGDFETIAKKTFYDETTGQFEVAKDLILIGIGGKWGLQRIITSNNEQWLFSATPEEPTDLLSIDALCVRDCLDTDDLRRYNYNASLIELNTPIE
jgi:hypothetical protein